MPNLFAYFMLWASPLFVFAIFRKLPLPDALIWSMLLAFLGLPSATSVDLPLLPALDKTTLPNMAAGVACIYFWRKSQRAAGPAWQAQPSLSAGPRPGMALTILVLLFFATPVVSMLTNRDPVVFGVLLLPGMTAYDLFSILMGSALTILPLYLGRRFLGSAESHDLLLRAFCIGALVYSLPMIFEARMSPQLHVWIYGFFQHEFLQHIRQGGYRPIVFLTHGLLLGMFICLSLLAAIPVWRARRADRVGNLWIFGFAWLCVAMFIAKSLGPLILALIFAPLLILGTPRLQVIVAACIGLLILIYPMLRGADLVPVDAFHEWTLAQDAERAQSLKFRFDSEDLLLARAEERPLAGWGSWGRQFLYDVYSGKKLTVPDGTWVITIGSFGWLGYIAQFGLLTLPLFQLAFRARRLNLTVASAGLAVLHVVNLIDLIPNSSLTPLTWLTCGALLGRAALQTAPEGDKPALAQKVSGNRRPPSPTWQTAPRIIRQPRTQRH